MDTSLLCVYMSLLCVHMSLLCMMYDASHDTLCHTHACVVSYNTITIEQECNSQSCGGRHESCLLHTYMYEMYVQGRHES